MLTLKFIQIYLPGVLTKAEPFLDHYMTTPLTSEIMLHSMVMFSPCRTATVKRNISTRGLVITSNFMDLSSRKLPLSVFTSHESVPTMIKVKRSINEKHRFHIKFIPAFYYA